MATELCTTRPRQANDFFWARFLSVNWSIYIRRVSIIACVEVHGTKLCRVMRGFSLYIRLPYKPSKCNVQKVGPGFKLLFARVQFSCCFAINTWRIREKWEWLKKWWNWEYIGDMFIKNIPFFCCTSKINPEHAFGVLSRSYFLESIESIVRESPNVYCETM